MDTKTCYKCNQTLPIKLFSKNKKGKDGLHSYCKTCFKEYSKTNDLKPKKIKIKHPDGCRICTICKNVKSLDEFSKSKSSKSGFRHACKSCNNILNKKWRKNNTEKRRAYQKTYNESRRDVINARGRKRRLNPEYRKKVGIWHKIRLYGMTHEKYEELNTSQKGLCKICGKTNIIKGEVRPLFVDHNHKTGKVRALLCRLCNFGMGNFLDDPTLLRLAANYLDQFNLI